MIHYRAMEQKVVSNTTPIITLLKISEFELLQKLFGKIIIPTGVYEEIEAGKSKKFYLDLKNIDWIEIRNVKETRELLIDLDKGEAETILLAKEINANYVIIDEKLGRKYANYFDLKVIGTLGILKEAKKRDLIKDLKEIVNKMKENNIWLSKKIIDDIFNN